MTKKWYTVIEVSGVMLCLLLAKQGSAVQTIRGAGHFYAEPFILGVAMESKQCNECRKILSLDEFHRDKNREDGRVVRCKSCIREYGKRYRKENQEVLAARIQKHRKENPEIVREWARKSHMKHRTERLKHQKEYGRTHKKEQAIRGRRWYDKHLVEKKEYDKEYGRANKELRAVQTRVWREANAEELKEKKKAYALSHPWVAAEGSYRRRARKAGVDEDFTAEMELFARDFWGNRCAICGDHQSLFKRKMPIDHWLPLSPQNGGMGYPLAPGNAVLLCIKHNGQKQDLLARQVFDEKDARRIELMLQDQINAWNGRDVG